MGRFLRMGAAVATLCCGGGAWGQTAPVPIDPASWVTNDDYPVAALQKGLFGTVEVAFAVDDTGRATACTTVKSSGSAILDSATCAAMMPRARFEPARDANGKAVAGTSPRRVRWQNPADAPQLLIPYASVSRITVGANGQVSNCETRFAGEKGVQFDVCARYGDAYPAGDIVRGYGPGVLTFALSQTIEGASPLPNVPTSDMPPNWTSEERLAIDAAGIVTQCRLVSSSQGTTDCPVGGRYLPPPDGKPVHIVKTTSTAFQPAQ